MTKACWASLRHSASSCPDQGISNDEKLQRLRDLRAQGAVSRGNFKAGLQTGGMILLNLVQLNTHVLDTDQNPVWGSEHV